MKRDRVFGVTFLANPNELYLISDVAIGDVFGQLHVTLFIKKGERIMVGIRAVKGPSFSRMVWIVKLTSQWSMYGQWEGGGTEGNGRNIGGEGGHWFVFQDAILRHEWICAVKDLGDEEEVLDIFKILVGGVEVFVAKGVISEDVDGGHKPLSPCFIGIAIFSGVLHRSKKSPAPLSDVADILQRWSCELCGVDLDW